MEHYARVIFEGPFKQRIDESIFPTYELFESTGGSTVIHFPLPRLLNPAEADEYAERLGNYMVEQGLQEFDIDISTDIELKPNDMLEETMDGDSFFDFYGWIHEDCPHEINEAKDCDGNTVTLNKPIRSGDNGPKKFHVYVKCGDSKCAKKINFGDPNMEIKRDNPGAKANFNARHNCKAKKDKCTAGYWSCKNW